MPNLPDMASEPAAISGSSASWKFQFEDTVNADPLAKGACLKVLRVYLNFASKAKPEAFCSLPNLMLLSGSSKPRVLRAKATLEQLGYLVPLYVTEEGSMMYRLVNARKETVADHIRIGIEGMAAEKRFRKQQERKARRGNKTIPPEDVDFEQNVTPAGNETIPNTVDESRRDSCSEGREGLVRDSPSSDNRYALVDDDPTIPFDVPSNDNEADEILSHFGNVNPVVLGALRRMLMAGELTPALLSVNLGGHHG